MYRILKIFRDCVNSLSARFISCGRLAASAFGIFANKSFESSFCWSGIVILEAGET